MKKYLMAVAIMFIMMFTVNQAFSADQILDTKVKQVVTKLDKNGNEYTRIMISEMREKNGIKYPADVMVMCFNDTVAKAKTLKVGDNLKAVVSESVYQGRTNYNLVAFVNHAPVSK